MKTAAIYDNLEFNEKRPLVQVLFETTFTKEIRIAMYKGNEMKEHKTSFPIVVEIVDGSISFGLERKVLNLTKGQLIALDGGVPHSLIALEESVIRLTLTKSDEAKRVAGVAEK